MSTNSGLKPFLAELEWRGLLKQKTAELLEPDFNRKQVLYCGFDPTASSLHAGSLMPILGMDRFRRRGGQLIVLVGGATGLIGDPSGRDQERTLETESAVGERVAKLSAQMQGLFDKTDGPKPIFVNNGDWYRGMGVVQFLRDVGKHFSVNQMLMKDSVRTRIENREQGISYTEFSYQLLQSYDFVHLYKTYGCTMQMGASDQWGNIVAGADLVRRITGETVHGITLPLLTNSEGKKYGKSEKGAVWLDPELTSPYEFYQFWLNSSDADVSQFLLWFTDFTAEELEALKAEPASSRKQQRVLAQWLTARVHGQAQAELARRASAVIFSNEYGELKGDVVETLAKAVPTVQAPANEPYPVWAALTGLKAAASKGEVRRLVDQKSVSANGVTLTDMNADLREHGKATQALVLSVGKARRFLVRF